ncbi:MAG: hypothetical protein WCP79_02625 [Bacillota bacterium]
MKSKKSQLTTLVVLIALFANFMPIATAMSRTAPAPWAIAVTGAPPNASVNVKPTGTDDVIYNVQTDANGAGQIQVHTPCDQAFIDKFAQRLYINHPPDWVNHLVKQGAGGTFKPGVSPTNSFTLRIDVAKRTYVLLDTNNYDDTNIIAATKTANANSKGVEAGWAIVVIGAPANASVNIKPVGNDSVVYNVQTDAKGTGQMQVKTPCDQAFIDNLPQNLHINYPPDWINHLPKHASGDTFQSGVSSPKNFTLRVDVAKNSYNLLNTNDLRDTNTIPATNTPSNTNIPATSGGSESSANIIAGLFNTIGAAQSGDSVTYRSQMLMLKLSIATKLFGSALIDVARAWNMDADKIAAVDLAAKKAREKPDDSKAQAEYLESTKRLNDQVKARVEKAEKDNEQASDALKAAIRNAEIQKGIAWLINASAVPDAVVLVSDAYKIVNDPNVSWIEKIFRGGQVLYTAYAIKKAIDEQSALLTTYSDYMDKFRATQDIPKPSDNEIKQVAKDMQKG